MKQTHRPHADQTKESATTKQPLHVAQLKAALLKIDTVIAVSGLSKSSIYSKMKSGEFPSPVRLGARCTRWRAADLNEWLLQVGQ